MATFSDRFKLLQVSAGMSDVDVMKLTEIPRSSYYNYLAGVRMPPVETLIRIADTFGVSLDYLVGRDDVQGR